MVLPRVILYVQSISRLYLFRRFVARCLTYVLCMRDAYALRGKNKTYNLTNQNKGLKKANK